ncbi:MAG: amidase [Micrococcales bacterium 73-13]|nr:MAG: amidase [Micrococcales bacterium 73-13]
MADLHELTAIEQRDALRRGELSSVELVTHYLGRIESHGATVGAFVEVTAARALETAAAIDADGRAAAATRPILGLPFADKDLVARAGVPTRYGSRLMAANVPEVSDPLVDVLDAAGGVSLGKTATPEFGTPSYTEPLAGVPARTPWDLRRGAGGSSGGAAAAVAAGLLPFAPGSDGGGSIRIPAAACGLVGLKPSRGRVPSDGGFGFPGGLVTAGPLARTVADAALLLDAMAPAGAEPTWATAPPGGGPFLAAASRAEPTAPLRIGVTTVSPWSSWYEIAVSPEARAALDTAIAELGGLGHRVEELEWTPGAAYPDHFRVIWQAGPASLPIPDEAVGLLEPLTAWLREEGRRRHVGELAAATGWLAGFERDTIAAFSGYDAVLTPTLAVPPPLVGHYDAADGERNFEQQCQVTPWTSFVNAAGLPAIQLPVLLTEPSAERPALPMGVQLIGRPGGEAVLLGLGAQLEAVLRWDARRPPIW